MIYRLAVVVAGAGLIAGAVLAAATPVTPSPGATVATSHPVFTWTSPSNEASDGIYIASKPDRTPEGKFFDENVVDAGFFFNNEQQWSPSSPLYAGHYWWLVWSHDRDTFQSYYSAPIDFTLPVSLSMDSVKLHRYLSLHWLEVNVRWRTNVHGLTVKVSLLRRGRIIWARTKSESNLIGFPGSTGFTWQRPRRIKQGTPLTLRVGVVVPKSSAAAGLVLKSERLRRSVRRPALEIGLAQVPVLYFSQPHGRLPIGNARGGRCPGRQRELPWSSFWLQPPPSSPDRRSLKREAGACQPGADVRFRALDREDPARQAAPALSEIQVRGPACGPPRPKPASVERSNFERHIYSVDASVTHVLMEADQDLHVVLEDGPAQMVAESPNAPFCTVGATTYRRKQMLAARDKVRICSQARIVGVVFWDRPHNVTGRAPNSIELHPILDFAWFSS